MAGETERRLIERHFLSPGTQVVAVKPDPDGALVVTSNRRWLVMPGTLWKWSVDLHGYTLFDVRADGIPPFMPHGIAVLPDGRTFHLNEEEELRAFFAETSGALSPEELSALVSTYQGVARFGYIQNPVLDVEALSERLDAAQIAAVPEFVPFQVVRRDDTIRIDFCTLFHEGPRSIRGLCLVRWHVETRGKALEWSARRIAEGLADLLMMPPPQ